MLVLLFIYFKFQREWNKEMMWHKCVKKDVSKEDDGNKNVNTVDTMKTEN